MTTLASYGTTTGGSTWTNRNNALYTPGVFATLTTTVVATYTLDITVLVIAVNLPSDALIDKVVVTIPHYVSNTARWNVPTLSAFTSGGVIAGTTSNLTRTTTTSNTNVITYTNLTATQLRDSTFGFRYSIAKSGTQSATTNVDYMKIDIDYQSESWQEVKL